MKTSKADQWFSRFIRLRAANSDGIGKCITCSRRKEVKYMDCGHYVKRQHSTTRFNEYNCQLQCKHCNAFEQGKDSVFRDKLVSLYGEQTVLILESSKRQTTKMGKVELNYIAELYKSKTNELLKEKGIEKWW
jgi:hypothetical protein